MPKHCRDALALPMQTGGGMLRSLESLRGFRAFAQDGFVGTIRDFCFDNQTWALRYVVLAREGFLGEEVFVAPGHLAHLDRAAKSFRVSGRIRHVAVHEPPEGLGTERSRLVQNAHLYRTRELRAFSIVSVDGVRGHVEDCIIDLTDWRVRYLLIETGSWVGATWLVAPSHQVHIDWENGTGFFRPAGVLASYDA